MESGLEIKPHNPSAFPFSDEYETDGMTLRDYFAAKALASAFLEHKAFGGSTYSEQCKELAESCYIMAEAMLKARMHDNSPK